MDSTTLAAGEPLPVPPDPETPLRISAVTGGTFTEASRRRALDGADLRAGLGTRLRWRGRLP
jgi:hypothetical protein